VPCLRMKWEGEVRKGKGKNADGVQKLELKRIDVGRKEGRVGGGGGPEDWEAMTDAALLGKEELLLG